MLERKEMDFVRKEEGVQEKAIQWRKLFLGGEAVGTREAGGGEEEGRWVWGRIKQ